MTHKLSNFFSSPIKKNIIANFFGIGVQLINQIVLVPIYILCWGNELYSDWIVLSALTTIFSLSDVGLNNVIQNRFSIKLSEGDIRECKSLLTNNFVLVFGTLLITLLVVFVFVNCIDITELMSIHILNRTEANCVFVILLVKVFIGMLSGIESSVYRASHKASRAIYMDQICNLCIAIITLFCVYIKCDIVLMCVFVCLPQIVLVLVKHRDSQQYFSYIFSLKYFDWNSLKNILLPSFTFMSFPLSNTIVLQGYTLVVNSFFGAESVVLYNTTRTLCNFMKSLLSTIQGSVWPEYSIAFGSGNYTKMKYLHRKTIKVTISASVLMGIFLLILGPFIYQIWTHNAVTFKFSLMVVFVAILILQSLWTSSSVTLMATNNHSKLGGVNLICSSISLVLAYIAGYFGYDLSLIASTLIFMHICMAIYTIKAGFTLTKDKFTLKSFFGRE